MLVDHVEKNLTKPFWSQNFTHRGHLKRNARFMYAKKSNSMSQLTSLEYVFSEDVVVAAVSNMGLATKICAKKVPATRPENCFGVDKKLEPSRKWERYQHLFEGHTVTPPCLRRLGRTSSVALSALRFPQKWQASALTQTFPAFGWRPMETNNNLAQNGGLKISPRNTPTATTRWVVFSGLLLLLGKKPPKKKTKKHKTQNSASLEGIFFFYITPSETLKSNHRAVQ